MLFNAEVIQCPECVLYSQVKIKSRSAVQSPKMTVCVQPPLAVTQDQFVLDSMGMAVFPFLAYICPKHT